MPTHRHTLIRTNDGATRSPYFSMRRRPGLQVSPNGFESNSLTVTDVDVTEAELADIVRDPSVVGIPRAFPIRLISPVDAADMVERADAIPDLQATDANTTGWGITEVGAHISSFDGAGVRLAVIDSGIDAAHMAFSGVTLDRVDFTNTGIDDDNGHGTHCAGTIFGRDINGTRIGVARGVTDAMIGKVLDANGSGDSAMLFKAIAWAINGGANVVSMSLGFDFPGYAEYLHTQQGYPITMATSIALRDYTANLRAFDALMAFAASQIPFSGGSVIAAAAGNEALHPEIPISASVPAAANGVVSVGAVSIRPTGVQIARFSNTDCQLVAPGVDIVSAKAGGGLVAFNGTSMACPHVAGVAALWWHALLAQGSPANATSVLAKLLASADKSRILGYRPVLHGNGMVKAP